MYIIEVMGKDCGYLALMSALATGAEQAYYAEQGLTFDTLISDLNTSVQRFDNNCRYVRDHKI